jgi:hypothetical protein
LLNCKALFLCPKGDDKLPIQPSVDKGIVRHRIVTDPYILSLGFSSRYTYNTNTTDDKLEADKKQIFIYSAPSRKNYSNTLTLEMLLHIDISVPEEQGLKADLCAEQVIALLDNYDIGNGSRLSVVAPSPCAVSCQNGFYCVGVRFSYYVTKINEIKTI